MKKNYLTPDLEVILLDEEDIITSSIDGKDNPVTGQDGDVDA